MGKYLFSSDSPTKYRNKICRQSAEFGNVLRDGSTVTGSYKCWTVIWLGEMFVSSKCPDQLWSLSSCLFAGNWRLFVLMNRTFNLELHSI